MEGFNRDRGNRSGGHSGGRGGFGGHRSGGRGGFGGGRGRGGFGGGRRNFGPREMHKATCAECKKECEVPFKPRGDKPVYCKECFMKKRDQEESGSQGNSEDSEDSE